MKTTKILLISTAIYLSICSFSVTTAQGHPQNWEVHVTMGIPTDSDPSDDYLIQRKQYVLSYNKDRNVANWVSWNLNWSYYGRTARYKGKFIADKSLPKSFYRVKDGDYTNSGYERGHMVRSEERTRNKTDNKATFILSNVMPQKADLNKGVWLNFEYYCENLCESENKELYIIAGGVFHSDHTIKGKIAVPDSCFKIVVVLERGQGLEDVTKSTEVKAVMMPNKDGVRYDDWQEYKTTVDRIERSTGYDFLSNVPKDVQAVIESK